MRAINDDGQGFDIPIMTKGDNYAIFDNGSKFIVVKKFRGEIASFPKTVSNELWENLKKQGWIDAEY